MRPILILSETALVLALALVWFLSEEIRESTNLLGVFLAGTPRSYLLALFRAVFEFSDLFLAALFLVMLLAVNIPSLAQALNGKTSAEADSKG